MSRGLDPAARQWLRRARSHATKRITAAHVLWLIVGWRAAPSRAILRDTLDDVWNVTPWRVRAFVDEFVALAERFPGDFLDALERVSRTRVRAKKDSADA